MAGFLGVLARPCAGSVAAMSELHDLTALEQGTAIGKGEANPGQFLGRKRTASAASAKKWTMRSTSRLVLSIGYIHCSAMSGIK